MGTRSGNTMDEKLGAFLSKFVHFETQIAQIPALTTWMSGMDSHITKTLGDFATRLTEMEQNFSTLTARLCKVEPYATSASNVTGSARSWPSLEQDDGSTATEGPTAQDHLMTTETQDADLIFSQALLMNMREVPSFYDFHVHSTTLELRNGSILFGKGPTYQPTINLSQFIARQAPCRSDSCSKQEPSVRTLWPDIKMMVSPMKLTVLSAAPKQLSRFAKPKSLEDREGQQFSLLWRVLADQLKILFPEGDDEGAFIIPALDTRSHVLSIKDRRSGIGKPVFKLAPLGNGQIFTLVAPDLSVLGVIPDGVLQRVLSQANKVNV